MNVFSQAYSSICSLSQMDVLFYIYLVVLLLSIVAGSFRYARLDAAARVIFWLLVLTLISEATTIYTVKAKIGKAPVYHFYSAVEIFMTTLYFLKTIKPYHHKFLVGLSAILYPLIAILNCIFLQPLHEINTNMISLESIIIIPMALYALYKMLVNDEIMNMFKYPHFWLWTSLLIYWSSVFFFWACFNALMKDDSPYKNLLLSLDGYVNIVVYAIMGLTLLFYPKKKAVE